MLREQPMLQGRHTGAPASLDRVQIAAVGAGRTAVSALQRRATRMVHVWAAFSGGSQRRQPAAAASWPRLTRSTAACSGRTGRCTPHALRARKAGRQSGREAVRMGCWQLSPSAAHPSPSSCRHIGPCMVHPCMHVAVPGCRCSAAAAVDARGSRGRQAVQPRTAAALTVALQVAAVDLFFACGALHRRQCRVHRSEPGSSSCDRRQPCQPVEQPAGEGVGAGGGHGGSAARAHASGAQPHRPAAVAVAEGFVAVPPRAVAPLVAAAWALGGRLGGLLSHLEILHRLTAAGQGQQGQGQQGQGAAAQFTWFARNTAWH